MIVRITFLNEDSIKRTMLFGNSYKNWFDQYMSYLYRYIKWYDTKTLLTRKIFGIDKVETSLSKWKSWGGLGWCSHETFQKELNREGCQSSEPDKKHPRQYSQMVFRENCPVEQKVLKAYKQRIRHLK